MWAAEAYLRWLPEFLSPLVRVENTESASRICTRGPSLMLLETTPSDDRSTADRALLYVTDGRLARVRDPVRGRLEMRTVGDGRCSQPFMTSSPTPMAGVLHHRPKPPGRDERFPALFGARGPEIAARRQP